ncbi:hypothetical protein [Streptomyces pactum]|uniref:Uncharacterized protein n=1 Tax=Streptomyces pactum TaxID=68249 RepID=A0A1S6J4K2_9ACTN|nr:hypothetical protein [Streptomyces pactum]AQS66699.1 hypothetical protein B1H29_06940 [Streptomyces pactum]
MDVTRRLLRAVAARPRVLLVTLPGGTAVRLAAERHLRLRDWPVAATPAEADLLVVAGPDRPETRPPLTRLWRDMAAPRARVHAPTVDDVERALNDGRTRLGSPTDADADAGHPERAGREEHGGRNQALGGGHDAHGAHGVDHGDGGGGHGDGGGGHGDDGMEMPGGLPMAERGEDRDGLTLDRLHVPLGPFLVDWPSGLTVRLVLQGDVIQQADLAEPTGHAGEAPAPFWAEPWLRAEAGEAVTVGEAARRRSAAHLDSLGRLLAVAGLPAEAVAARRLRDDLLAGAATAAYAPGLARFAHRVGRSRTLAWLTRGIGGLDTEEAREAGVSGPAARAGGDVTDRYRQWLTDLLGDVGRLDEPALLEPDVQESPRGHWRTGHPPSAALVALLPRLLTGTELAAARLVVAGLDPDLDELAARRREVPVRA